MTVRSTCASGIVIAFAACAPRGTRLVVESSHPAAATDMIDLRTRRHVGEQRRFSVRTNASDRTTTAIVVIETIASRPDGSADRRMRFEAYDVTPMVGPAAQLLEPLRAAVMRMSVDFAEDSHGVTTPAEEASSPSNPFDVAARAFAGNVFTMLPQLPDHSVRPGDHWTGHLTTRLRSAQLNSDTDYEWTYTLTRVVRTPPSLIAEIDVSESATLRSQPGSPGVAGRGDGRGSIRFDVSAGDVLDVRIAGDLNMHATEAGMPDEPSSHHEFELQVRDQWLPDRVP